MRGVGSALVFLLVMGCTAPASLPDTREGAKETADPAPHVMVGIMDSGVNVYHDVFQDPSARLPPGIMDARTGQAPVHVQLTRHGSYQERVQADQAVWASLQPGRLYWFEGTRVLGISVADERDSPPILDQSGHGTAVASTVRDVSHDAWIVMVQVHEVAIDDVSHVTDNVNYSNEGASIAWLADQPWVDVISLSIGFEGNPPLPTWKPYVDATKLATARGKLVTVAAGNLPTPTISSGSNGPPWVISVGGVEPSTHGAQPQSGQIVDVVSDYTRSVAARDPSRYYNTSGTSLSAPVVGGALANAILNVRNASGYAGGLHEGLLCPCARELSAADFREALNLTASYWNTTDYAPLNTSLDPYYEALSPTVPVLPVTPWVQMGWGYVGQDAGDRIAAVVLGQGAPPPKPSLAVAYMDTMEAARAAYWDTVGPLS